MILLITKVILINNMGYCDTHVLNPVIIRMERSSIEPRSVPTEAYPAVVRQQLSGENPASLGL